MSTLSQLRERRAAAVTLSFEPVPDLLARTVDSKRHESVRLGAA